MLFCRRFISEDWGKRMHKEEIREAGGIRFLEFGLLRQSGVLHGYTLRQGGVSRPPFASLNMGLHVGDDREHVLENRQRLATALGYSAGDVVAGQQVHGTVIARAAKEVKGSGSTGEHSALAGTDGLICNEPGIVLMAHSADCTLLFFHDPVARWIGLAHAGWRGAVAGMGPAMVEAMCAKGCVRENIHAVLAPSIGPCCYKVGENVAEAVPGQLRRHVLSARGDGVYFDLPGLQRLQLLASGIRHERLAKSAYCTSCRCDLFYSYRASAGQTGRMAGVIMLGK